MAKSSFFLSSMLLYSLLVGASALDYGHEPNPNHDNLFSINTIGIQGLILCKSGLQLSPLEGAMARITCVAEKNGYELSPFSVSSQVSDEKGFFFATLPISKIGENLKIKECKAFLEDSPLESCQVPTDANNGISGASLSSSSFRFLQDKQMRLYTVGPFIFSTEPDSVPNDSVPNGY
ncbi:hypothetical protein UlMin_030670 [Ulmus minor]